MRLLQEEAGHTSSLYIYEDSEGYEPLAKIESDLRPLRKQDAELDASKAAPNQQAHSPNGQQPQSLAAANDQHYEDGWPISPQRTLRSITISSIAGSVQGAGATRQFDPKSLLQAAQSAPSYLSASKAGLPMRVLYFHNDVNGAPEELTDGQGEIVWNVSYQVWGNTFRETYQPSEITRQNIRFQGQYLDRETGLHYNTFRYYDPDVGRFTTTDPISLAGGFNLYQYAPNPTFWIDPWGWCSGNSKASRKKQHGYEIVDTHTGKVAKTGVSGGRIKWDAKNKKWQSSRANRQANKWNKEPGNTGRYQTRVVKHVKAGPGARYKILQWEKRNATRLRNMGQLDPMRHKIP